MDNKPPIIFDTSALNSLGDDVESAALICGITAGFTVCLTGTSIDEIAATSCTKQRQKLLNLCRRLLSAGYCILPHDPLLRTLVNHYSATEAFDWTSVPARFPDYEEEIARQENITCELAEKQRVYNRSRLEEFAKLLDGHRSAFDALHSGETATRPSAFSEFLSRLRVEGGAFWGIGASFYERECKSRPDEKAIREFIDGCPPFRAWLVAIALAQYDRCVSESKSGPSLRAGKFDLYMSVYLPYCIEFITADKKQLCALREVVTAACIGVRVRPYHEFKNGLLGVPTVVASPR